LHNIMTKDKNDTVAISQASVFRSGEGDAWLDRNRSAVSNSDPSRERIADAIRRISPSVRRALEIGSSVGTNLEMLRRQYPGGDYYGVDPSAKAVSEGTAMFPSLHLQQGTADNLPFPDAFFDLVWFGFCLYLVDRSSLFRVVAEADRVLGSGGILAITDFDPQTSTKRTYRHREGLFSYKMNYANLYLANPSYRLAEKLSFGHTSSSFERNPPDRSAFWLLYKDNDRAYDLEEDK
jgi:ubiquinone/menaquinone biosynthesis C-methylase UbiE